MALSSRWVDALSAAPAWVAARISAGSSAIRIREAGREETVGMGDERMRRKGCKGKGRPGRAGMHVMSCALEYRFSAGAIHDCRLHSEFSAAF